MRSIATVQIFAYPHRDMYKGDVQSLSYSVGWQGAEMSAVGPWGEVTASGEHGYGALRALSDELRRRDWDIAVNGLRCDVYCSGRNVAESHGMEVTVMGEDSEPCVPLLYPAEPTLMAPPGLQDILEKWYFSEEAGQTSLDRLEHVEDRFYRHWLRSVRPLPPPSAEQCAEALANPNSWLPVIDPEFEKSDGVPSWAVRGRYPVDAQGRLGEFVANSRYVAGPQMRRYISAPECPFEYTLALFAAGYATEQVLWDALRTANLIVKEHPDGPGQLYPQPDRRGQLVLPVYTAWRLRPRFGGDFEVMSGRDLLAANNGRYKIMINPRAMGAVRATLLPDGSCWRYPAGR